MMLLDVASPHVLPRPAPTQTPLHTARRAGVCCALTRDGTGVAMPPTRALDEASAVAGVALQVQRCCSSADNGPTTRGRYSRKVTRLSTRCFHSGPAHLLAARHPVHRRRSNRTVEASMAAPVQESPVRPQLTLLRL